MTETIPDTLPETIPWAKERERIPDNIYPTTPYPKRARYADWQAGSYSDDLRAVLDRCKGDWNAVRKHLQLLRDVTNGGWNRGSVCYTWFDTLFEGLQLIERTIRAEELERVDKNRALMERLERVTLTALRRMLDIPVDDVPSGYLRTRTMAELLVTLLETPDKLPDMLGDLVAEGDLTVGVLTDLPYEALMRNARQTEAANWSESLAWSRQAHAMGELMLLWHETNWDIADVDEMIRKLRSN